MRIFSCVCAVLFMVPSTGSALSELTNTMIYSGKTSAAVMPASNAVQPAQNNVTVMDGIENQPLPKSGQDTQEQKDPSDISVVIVGPHDDLTENIDEQLPTDGTGVDIIHIDRHDDLNFTMPPVGDDVSEAVSELIMYMIEHQIPIDECYLVFPDNNPYLIRFDSYGKEYPLTIIQDPESGNTYGVSDMPIQGTLHPGDDNSVPGPGDTVTTVPITIDKIENVTPDPGDTLLIDIDGDYFGSKPRDGMSGYGYESDIYEARECYSELMKFIQEQREKYENIIISISTDPDWIQFPNMVQDLIKDINNLLMP